MSPTVTVRFFAGAAAAAGAQQEVLAAGTLGELRRQLSARPSLTRVVVAASFLVDGVSTRDDATPLPAGATVDVLPPFAGG